MESLGSSSHRQGLGHCARMARPVTSSECCEIITSTQNSADLATCRTCPEGMAIMGTARIGKQEDQEMAKGKCQCCGITAVIYRRGGVDRCYHCDKSRKDPLYFPGEDKADEAAPVVPSEASTDGCQCAACEADGPHLSDCAVHNAPALPVGPCDCGRSETTVSPDAAASFGLALAIGATERMVGSEDHFVGPNNMVPPEGQLVGVDAKEAEKQLTQALAYSSWDWDDFIPIKRDKPLSLTASVRAGDKLTLSVDLSAALGWEKGQLVVIRENRDRTMMAISRTDDPYRRGENYVLTMGKKCPVLAINCGEPLEILGTPGGKYAVSMTDFGCIVHLDRPVVGKGDAA